MLISLVNCLSVRARVGHIFWKLSARVINCSYFFMNCPFVMVRVAHIFCKCISVKGQSCFYFSKFVCPLGSELLTSFVNCLTVIVRFENLCHSNSNICIVWLIVILSESCYTDFLAVQLTKVLRIRRFDSSIVLIRVN